MPILNIVKEYRKNSKLAGIIETDKVEIARDEMLTFVNAVNENPRQEYTIVDYSWALVGSAEAIVVNPTGGYKGRMKDGKPF